MYLYQGCEGYWCVAEVERDGCGRVVEDCGYGRRQRDGCVVGMV